MDNRYRKITLDNKLAYINVDCLDKLRDVDAVIFDCDGVLIDIRESYNKAIAKTVNYILNNVVSVDPHTELVSEKVIHLLKSSGGFNNDWDTTYAILLFMFSSLPDEYRPIIIKSVNSNDFESKTWKSKFYLIKAKITESFSNFNFEPTNFRVDKDLLEYAGTMDESGILSLEQKLFFFFDDQLNYVIFLDAVRKLLSYPGKVSDSTLTAIFEEIFCGSKLFNKIYNENPRLNAEVGLVEKEKLIVTSETLHHLASIIKKCNFGIASGRPFLLAEYTLDELLTMFKPEALIFLDNVEEYERKKHKTLNLKKPNPFSLLKSAEGLEPFNFAVYIGDSIEDMKMVNKANNVDSRFISVGVYDSSNFKKQLVSDFVKSEVDIILPSANELSTLLEHVKAREYASI